MTNESAKNNVNIKYYQYIKHNIILSAKLCCSKFTKLNRRDVKEVELESLYSETGISGGIKRKVESLLQEQEKLGSRILELNLEKTGLLQELKS